VIISWVMGLGRRSLSCSSVASSLWLAGSLLLCTGPAHAQTDDQRSGARAAATAGGQAYMSGRWADAVDMFTRAESMVHSPVHLLYMARAYEKLGSLVKARESYIRITNEDLPAGASQPIKEAKSDAQKELDALEPRVPYVSVVVQGVGPKPVTVTMDGVNVPPALLGVPRPVDPGEHKFEAVAEGMDSAISSISVKEGRSETVVLTLHPGSAPAAQPPVGYAAPVYPGGAGAPPEADSGKHGPSPLTWVAFGVGGVGLVVGTVFALKSSSKVDDANNLCHLPGPDGTRTYCSPQASSLDDDARSAKTISLVGFIAGGVGVATGVTLLLVTGKHQKAAASLAPHVTPWLGLGSAGISGRF
jgi:hypothetical protein